MNTALEKPQSQELSRLEELDYERRLADAAVAAGKKAKLSDEELLPYARRRLDAWRAWGVELGPAATKAEAGRKGGSSDRPSPLDDAEKKARERARKIARVSEERFEEYKAAEEPDWLTLAGLFSSTAHLSSEKDEWATPQDLYDELDAEFGFGLDVCASDKNHKCKRYWTAADNGLVKEWRGTCWMNPPYSAIEEWMAKAREAGQNGATVVCLVPARTDVGWFWEFARHGEVRFLKGRLHFVSDEGKTGPAPFPSCLVIFGRPVKVRWYER